MIPVMNDRANGPPASAEAPVGTLLEIARRYGTPTYAYDVTRVRKQIARLRENLPETVEIFYSLKANASLGLCGLFADSGLGADTASIGELLTVLEAGFPPARILVAGPHKSPELVARLRSLPEALLSIDSLSELRMLADEGLCHRAVLRLRPDYESSAVVAAGPESRFGLAPEDIPACRDVIASGGIRVVGFHVFSGSQMLDPQGVIRHLRGAMDLSLRAADALGIVPEILNLGGGFGIPYRAGEPELNLYPVGEELAGLAGRVAPARILLELGRYLVAPAGWYLTAVLGHQTIPGRQAVVVDGGTHQRADLCGLDLRKRAAPPLVLNGSESPPLPTDVMGCLSLPSDILAESGSLPRLAPGDVLAFPNAGAYGLGASPNLFHGYPLPAEAAFDGSDTCLIRARKPAASVLDGQVRLVGVGASACSS